MSKEATIEKKECTAERDDKPSDDEKIDARSASRSMAAPESRLILAGPTNGYCRYCRQGEQPGVYVERCGGNGFIDDDLVCFACLEGFVRQMKFVHAPYYLYP